MYSSKVNTNRRIHISIYMSQCAPGATISPFVKGVIRVSTLASTLRATTSAQLARHMCRHSCQNKS